MRAVRENTTCLAYLPFFSPLITTSLSAGITALGAAANGYQENDHNTTARWSSESTTRRVGRGDPVVEGLLLNDNRDPGSGCARESECFDYPVAASRTGAQIEYQNLVLIVLDNIR